MTPLSLLFLTILFLLGTAILGAISSAFRKLRLQDLNYDASGKYFFYKPFHLLFFPEFEYESILCAVISGQNITRFAYALTGFFLISDLVGLLDSNALPHFWLFCGILGLITASFLLGDYLPRILGARFPNQTTQYGTPIASLFLFIAFPITYFGLRLTKSWIRSLSFEESLTQTKREIIELIQKTRLRPELNPHEKKLIEYVLRFKDRIAREIMVPRVDVFSLSCHTPIKEAARLIVEEGYSRIPVYKNSVDNIVGVLMHKDVLKEYVKYHHQGNEQAIIEAPIEKIQKPVLYTPETQKISNLLLEFRKKQVHLAIVVDEYGGTEGIVTIEDILEEIVGEIEDEYDEEEEMIFPQKDGSWVIDARIGILEFEELLGIEVPQEADYDTLGGFIFHCTGTIPPKGFVIHQELFELEILQSDERRVGKVRLRSLHDNKNKEPPSSDQDEVRNEDKNDR